MNIEILYEDKDYTAVYKPAGLVVHPDNKSAGPFLTDWVKEKYPTLEGDRPGIVHRLDKYTSGVLLIAKNPEAHEFLKNQFQNRTVQKKYYAFVHGHMKEKEGMIDRPIGRSKSDFRKFSSTRGAKGNMRDAETQYTVIKSDTDTSYILVEPKTGRTHQIRVHFAAINHPVVHDDLYAPNKPHLLGFERTALHAFSIKFQNMEGKEITVEAPFPEDFKNAQILQKDTSYDSV